MFHDIGVHFRYVALHIDVHARADSDDHRQGDPDDGDALAFGHARHRTLLPSGHWHWTVDRHDLLNHLFPRSESSLVVATERVLDDIYQALVAIGTWPFRLVASRRELVDEVVVRNERSGNAYRVAVPIGNGPADDRRGLEAAGADHGNLDRPLDRPRL